MKAIEHLGPFQRLVITLSEKEVRQLRDEIIEICDKAGEDPGELLEELMDCLHFMVSA